MAKITEASVGILRGEETFKLDQHEDGQASRDPHRRRTTRRDPLGKTNTTTNGCQVVTEGEEGGGSKIDNDQEDRDTQVD